MNGLSLDHAARVLTWLTRHHGATVMRANIDDSVTARTLRTLADDGVLVETAHDTFKLNVSRDDALAVRDHFVSLIAAHERTTSVRISRTAIDHLSGSQAWIDAERGNFETHDAETTAVFTRLVTAPLRRDKSISIALTPDEATALLDFADAWEISARNSMQSADGLGELNSARALVRALRAAGGVS